MQNMSSAAKKISTDYITSLKVNRKNPIKNKTFAKELALAGFVSFVLGIATYLSYHWFIYSRSHVETNNAYIESDVFQVQSRMMGYVKEVIAEEDKSFEKGATLLDLDETDIGVEKGVKEARLKKATADFGRGEILWKSKLISKSDFELLEASLAMAKADFQASLLKEKYSHVIAPQDGTIAKVFVKPGQFIQPGQNLFTLISQKKFWIKANYKETQLERIKVGQPVSIEVDAYPGVHFQGKVLGIYPSSGSILSLIPPENATGNFTKVVQRVSVKISVEPKEKYILRPGMSVTTDIDTRLAAGPM
jgi:membrane fusion protein (multidrug efflux system)